jgi:hypothetical protein
MTSILVRWVKLEWKREQQQELLNWQMVSCVINILRKSRRISNTAAIYWSLILIDNTIQSNIMYTTFSV